MKDDAKRGIAAFCRDAKPGLILIEDDKVIPAFEFAFEIAVRMARSEAAGQITIWSWKSIMNLHGMWLAGDSMSKIHCWTLGDETLAGNRDETWLEEIQQESWTSNLILPRCANSIRRQKNWGKKWWRTLINLLSLSATVLYARMSSWP